MVAALSLAIPPAVAQTSPAGDGTAKIAQAAAAVATGETEAAASLLAEATLSLGRVAAFSELTNRLIELGHWQAAREIALGNARAWMAAGNAADAGALLEALAAGGIEDASSLALLGEAQLRAGRAESALTSLRAARRLGDQRPQTLFNLASAAWENGDYETALRSFESGARSSGSAFAWQHQRGRLLRFLGRNEEAAAVLHEAVTTTPDAIDARLDLAWALDAAGRPEAAETAYRTVITDAPALTKAHYGLAQLLRRQGRPEEAQRVLSEFTRLFQRDRRRVERLATERARLDRGWDLLRHGDPPAAISHFRGLGELTEALDGLATALEANGQAIEAIAALERAVRLDPDDERLRRRLAQARLAAGR